LHSVASVTLRGATKYAGPSAAQVAAIVVGPPDHARDLSSRGYEGRNEDRRTLVVA